MGAHCHYHPANATLAKRPPRGVALRETKNSPGSEPMHDSIVSPSLQTTRHNPMKPKEDNKKVKTHLIGPLSRERALKKTQTLC